MKTIDIKGKPYVTVNERLKYFRDQDAFKGWQLVTSIVNADADMCLMKAEVIDEEGRVVSTGHAYEESANGFINKTSHVENCETSAVGRALGNMGIGIDDSVASFDEVANAITQQKDERPWLNEKTYWAAVEKMNTMGDKDERQHAYNSLNKSFKMKKDYRRQLLDIIEQQDIKLE